MQNTVVHTHAHRDEQFDRLTRSNPSVTHKRMHTHTVILHIKAHVAVHVCTHKAQSSENINIYQLCLMPLTLSIYSVVRH